MTSKPTDTFYVSSSNPDTLKQQTQESIQNSNNNDNSQEFIQSQPTFFPIVDVSSEMQRGNFLPLLHCLKHNLIQKDFLDSNGYNALHHAVSQGSIPIVLLLLDYFKFDVNGLSQNKLTPLIIACNYGFLEIIRILCERGALINSQDGTNFNALLYSVKNGKVPQIAYLLHQKADLSVTDTNGCTVVHWAAFKNNVFLLEMFKSIGLNLHRIDSQGLLPLQRAIQGEAFDAIKYLLEDKENKKPANLNLEEIANYDIKNMIRRKYLPTKFESLQEKCIDLFKAKSKKLIYLSYFNFWILIMVFYIRLIGRNMSYEYNMFFFSFSIYSIIYAFWYYFRKPRLQKKIKNVYGYEKLNTSGSAQFENEGFSSKLSSEVLDRLVRGDQRGTVIHEDEPEDFQSFLHEIAWYFETKNYKELELFDERDYCPKCLVKKSERSAHPKESKGCIPHFHHFSHCLGRAIDKYNHYLYMILLFNQTILLMAFLMSARLAITPATYKFMWVFETFFELWENHAIHYIATYLMTSVLCFWNIIFFGLEIYGIARNMTYHEIFNRNNCTYLFKIKSNSKGQMVKYFSNPYDMGILNNIKYYGTRLLH